MKKLNTLFTVLLAFLAFGVVETTFVACSDDDDDPSVVATFKESNGGKKSVVFYDNKSFSISEEGITAFTGSYTGDPTTTGTVTLTLEKIIKAMLDDESTDMSLIAITDEVLAEMHFSSRTLTATIDADGKTTVLGNGYTRE